MPATGTTHPARRKRVTLAGVFLAAIGLGAVAGGAAGVLGALGLVARPPAYAVAVLLAGFGALWFSFGWWKQTDEAVREAHKTSWFWGGSAGLVVVGAIAVALFGITEGMVGGQYGLTRQDAGMVLAGIVLTVVLMLIGYGICWAGWWFTRSR
ncbi:MAG: hypothetical protein ACOYM5_12470 [Caulobacter sp.]